MNPIIGTIFFLTYKGVKAILPAYGLFRNSKQSPKTLKTWIPPINIEWNGIPDQRGEIQKN